MSEALVKYGLGSLQADSGLDVIIQATKIAKELARIIEQCHLTTDIKGKRFVRVEGWNTLGAMMGVMPRELSVAELPDGDIEAVVELVRTSDGVVIGRGSALLGTDESSWASRPRFARRSMAVTRATGKAFRISMSWIMALAGYEVTPAEEMEGAIEGTYVQQVPPPPSAKAKEELHQKLLAEIVEKGLSENAYAAEQALMRKVPKVGLYEEKLAWMQLYRAWRNLGLDSADSANKANLNEQPK